MWIHNWSTSELRRLWSSWRYPPGQPGWRSRSNLRANGLRFSLSVVPRQERTSRTDGGDQWGALRTWSCTHRVARSRGTRWWSSTSSAPRTSPSTPLALPWKLLTEGPTRAELVTLLLAVGAGSESSAAGVEIFLALLDGEACSITRPSGELESATHEPAYGRGY